MIESNVIEQRARELPPEYRQKVIDYIELLLLDVKVNKTVRPSLTWAGGLSDIQEDVFSLQKKVLLWRDTDEISD